LHEHLKQLLAWLARLLPKQENSGNGAVQVGRAGGSVKVVNLTQHIYGSAPAPQRPASQAPPIRVSHPDRRSKQRPLPADQHVVLDLLDQVPDRIAVLDFMAHEFNTRMVIELDAHQLYRLRRYVEVILDRNKS
jgi:hypothetical protein